MELHKLLRSLCSIIDWQYAILWKLKHRAKMILTSEDAYYDSHEYHETMDKQCIGNTMYQVHGWDFSSDLLGLAVAKMSSHVYPLGKGVVGQVAVTGEYRWISADDHATNSSLFFEYSDGWECQFSAGVKTVMVLPVVPIGVIQLGSLKRVSSVFSSEVATESIEEVGENINLVNYIKNVFISLQDYSTGHGPDPMHFTLRTSLRVPAMSLSDLAFENVPDLLHAMEKDVKKETSALFLPFPCLNESQAPYGIHRKAVEAHETCSKLYGDQDSSLLEPTSDIMHLGHRKFIGFLPKEENFSWENIGLIDTGMGSKNDASSSLDIKIMNKSDLNVLTSLPEKVVFDSTCSHQDNNCENHELIRVEFNPKGTLNFPQQSGANSQNNTKLEPETEACDEGIYCTSLNFPAGCELHEALGPAFLKRWNRFNHAVKEIQKVELPEMENRGNSTSQLTSESCMEHPFDATAANVCNSSIANVCHSDSDVKSEESTDSSIQSPFASAEDPEGVRKMTSERSSLHQHSVAKEDLKPYLNSPRIGDLMSQKAFSSTCTSTYSEQFESIEQPAKARRKRSRLDGSGRPRPRDRQLIQDRIKQLRKLVPNGAKCSIASLLERTIKQTHFLQNITNIADKLNQSADMEIKLNDGKTVVRGSISSEQGSSWAMEVGGHLKVHSILVKNLNEKGQMFVEMLCEECSQFLEIAQAIQSLRLEILESATRGHGGKNWVCFMVEGQNNENIHRLDILWRLVQVLQSKSAYQQSL